VASLQTAEMDPGCIEIRRCHQSDALNWFADKPRWEGLKSAGMFESSLPVRGTFVRAMRGHWGVDNKVYRIMDMYFREDESRARTGYAAENLTWLLGFYIYHDIDPFLFFPTHCSCFHVPGRVAYATLIG
jgi:hypothetical protein